MTGLRVQTGAWAGSVTNRYGIYIESPQSYDIGATNEYGIYQQFASAKNYFAGSVGIGTASPVGALNIYSNVVRDDGWHSALEITSTGSNNFPSLFFSGQTSNTNYSAIVWTASTSGNNLNKIGATIAALPTSITNSDLQFYTNNAVGSATATEKMRITGGGNVGMRRK